MTARSPQLPREDQEFLARFQPIFKISKVAFARLNELGQTIHLCQRTSSLHVGNLEIVAEVRVGIFMVIARWQRTELPAKAFATGVVATRCTVAITPPVAKRFDNAFQVAIVGEDRSAFAHGDVVRGVET